MAEIFSSKNEKIEKIHENKNSAVKDEQLSHSNPSVMFWKKIGCQCSLFDRQVKVFRYFNIILIFQTDLLDQLMGP